MSAQFKPNGHSTVSPYLVVQDAAATIQFLEQAIEAEVLQRILTEEGEVLHAEVRLDDSIIMLADGNDDFPPVGSHVHVYVADVDTVYRKALEAGGRALQEPQQNEGEQDRRAGVADPGGTNWWIATQVGS